MKSESECVLRMLGAKSTCDILEYLDRNGKVQYSKMGEFVNTHTLNTRLRSLLEYNLIESHVVRTGKKTEWYEITDNGKAVLEHLRGVLKIMQN